MSSALSPDGKYLLVLNGGFKPPSVSVIETASGRVTSSVPVADGWLGLAFAPRGDRVYVGGGSQAAVFEFTFANGTLQPARTFAVVPADKRTDRDFIGDVALSPDGRLLYAADLYRDSIVVINPQGGVVIDRYKTGRRPYRILFHPDGKSFFVTHWADGTLGYYDTNTGSMTSLVRVAPHPTDLVFREGAFEAGEGQPAWAARIFVAAANTNNVYAVGISSGRSLSESVIESINLAMTPRQPLGMTPSALALSPDKKRLYVACSDANVAAVVDVAEERSEVEGFIPTGWYPTAVRALSSGTLVVLNGKGVRSYPNPNGPNPSKSRKSDGPGYVGRIQTGTASWIAPFDDAQLAAWTETAMANTPYRDDQLDRTNPLPAAIEHVVYIVKENRTYDQILGDMKEGNGDSSLVLFGENVTPNHHKLAREFVLLDNFYVNADVSAEGHHWSTAAIANDYVEKLWPNQYAKRRKLYDFEGQEPTAQPPAGYLWTSAVSAGLSIRNFGYWVENKEKAAPTGSEQAARVLDPVLARFTNRLYRNFDLDYPDVERAKVFLTELADYEKTGNMPKLIFMRLGNDHTAGTTPGRIAPLSAVADNDYALGQIVEGISHSRFWNSTAIFVLEDDAQDGPDHVDSHRSPAFVISPYVKRRAVDSTRYNTTSVLRTMEFILGLRPMTQFDASARPMTSLFQPGPDSAPYSAEKPRIALDQRNPADGPGARASARMNFQEADDADDDELNDVLWLAIRRSPPPPPVRSYFAR